MSTRKKKDPIPTKRSDPTFLTNQQIGYDHCDFNYIVVHLPLDIVRLYPLRIKFQPQLNSTMSRILQWHRPIL